MSFPGIYSAGSEWLVSLNERMHIPLVTRITTQSLDRPVSYSPVCQRQTDQHLTEDEDKDCLLALLRSICRGIAHTTITVSTGAGGCRSR
jgi:hypothetical protein